MGTTAFMAGGDTCVPPLGTGSGHRGSQDQQVKLTTGEQTSCSFVSVAFILVLLLLVLS